MKREEYEEAKRKNADWDKEASADLKTWSKLFIFDSVLSRREYKTIIDTIAKRIESFVSLIDEKEIAEKYRSDLTEYAQQIYEWTQDHFGKFTPHVLAMALSDKSNLTKAQIAVVSERGATALSIAGPLDARFGSETNDGAYTQAASAGSYFEDVQKAVKQAMADFEALEVKPKYYANVNPRNIAEMLVRFNAYKQKKKELIDKGVKIVLVPSHGNCSKRCEPFQGKFYSLDGTSGTTEDGRRYIPIEEVADNMTYTSKNTGRTYYCGLFAYNCRHEMVEYKKGMNVERIPHEVIERRRAVEMEQRKMERAYRSLREKSELYYILYHKTKNPDIQKIARAAQIKAQNLKKKYIAFSKENDIAYIPTRLRIIAGENRYVRTIGKKDAIAKEALRMKKQQERTA